MKTRSWIILTYILCGFISAGAQNSKYSAGIKAGFGIPNLTAGSITTPLSENYSSRFGFYGGLIGELQIGEHFGLRGEINYSSQGGKREGMQAVPLAPELEPLWQMLTTMGVPHDDYMYANIKSEAILNYLEIPVMAKYSFTLNTRLSFYLQAGPYAGILINAKNMTSGSSELYVDKAASIPVDGLLELGGQNPIGPLSFDHTENITSEIKRFNFGFQGAAGFGFKTGPGKVFLEGGGNYGFLTIQKSDANGNNNTGAGTVTLGYLMNL